MPWSVPAPVRPVRLKIVLHTAKYGYSGEQFAAQLKKYHVIPEFYDGEYLVLMVTPENTALDFARLLTSLDTLKPKKALPTVTFSLQKAVSHVSLREAMLGPQEIVPIKKALGRICAAPTVSCPPAIPIVISGEEITKEAIEIFRFYGVEKIAVRK